MISVFSEEGASALRENFNLCQPLGPNNYTLFRDWAHDTYAALALVNYAEEGSFLTPLPANPVKVSNIFFFFE